MKGTATSSITPVVPALRALAALSTLLLLAIGPSAARAQTTDGSSTTTDDSSAGAVDGAEEGEAAPVAATAAPATAADDGDDAADETAEAEGSDELASGSASGEEGDEDDDAVDADHDGSADDDEPDPARSEEEAEAAQATAEPLAWRNSFFSWTMGSTFNTFYRGADLSYNPLYYWSFFLTPRWYLSSNVFFVVNQGLYYEFTDDDGATYNHEPQLYDTTIELRATFVADRFIFIPAVRLTIPVSKLSQAAQRYFNTGLGLTVVANLPEVANGNLALSLAYRRWWGATNVPLAAGPAPTMTTNDSGSVAGYAPGRTTGAGAGIDPFGDTQSDDTTLSADRLLVGLTWNLTPVEGLTITLSGFLLWDQGYGLLPVDIGAMGNPNGARLPDGTSHWRMFSSYTAQIAYDLAPWFNLGLGISNATNLSPFFAPDGSVLSPFNPNTQVFLSATVTLDGIYETIVAGGEEDGLTPEERQRRRQGLAAIDEDLLDAVLSDVVVDPDADSVEGDEATGTDEDESGAPRATGTF